MTKNLYTRIERLQKIMNKDTEILQMNCCHVKIEIKQSKIRCTWHVDAVRKCLFSEMCSLSRARISAFFRMHDMQSCQGKKCAVAENVETEQASFAFVRANLWQPVCADRRNVDCRLRLSTCAQEEREREKERQKEREKGEIHYRHRRDRFVLSISSESIAILFKAIRGEGASEKPRIMIPSRDNVERKTKSR